YTKKSITSHQKLTGDLLQKDNESIKFRLKTSWMRTAMLLGCICNLLPASSSIRHLHVRFVRVRLRSSDMKKLLLIEDDLDLHQLLKYNLESFGFQFTGANTGQGALELCLKERPDLIILDIMLLDSNGLEICERLRNHSVTAGTPIIFL